MVRMDEIHRGINKVKAPMYWPWKSKNTLRLIGKQFQEITDDYLEWQDEAWAFYQNPTLNIMRSRDFNIDLDFLHYTNYLVNRIHQINNKLDTIYRDGYQLRSTIDNKKAYFIAFVGITLALATSVFNILSYF